MANPYELLGVKPDADAAEIKKNYRQKAKSMHPDSGGAKEDFERLSRAYDVLKDPNLKAAFDQGRLNLDKDFNQVAQNSSNTAWGASAAWDMDTIFRAARPDPERQREAAEQARQRYQARQKEEAIQARAALKEQLGGMKTRLSAILERSTTLSDKILQDRVDMFNPKIIERAQHLAASAREVRDNTLTIMNDAAAAVAERLSNRPKTYQEDVNEKKAAEYDVKRKLHELLQNPGSAPSLYVSAANELQEALRNEGADYESINRAIENGDVGNLKAQAKYALEKTKPGVMGALTGAVAKHKEKTAVIMGMIDAVSSLERGVEAIKREVGKASYSDFYITCRVLSDDAPIRPVPIAIPAAEISINDLRNAIGLKNGYAANTLEIKDLTLDKPKILEALLRPHSIGYSLSYKLADIAEALSQGNRDAIVEYTRGKIEDVEAYVDAFETAKNKQDDKYAKSIEQVQNTITKGMDGIDGLMADLDAGGDFKAISEKVKELSKIEFDARSHLKSVADFAHHDAAMAVSPFEHIKADYSGDLLKPIRRYLQSQEKASAATQTYRPEGLGL